MSHKIREAAYAQAVIEADRLLKTARERDPRGPLPAGGATAHGVAAAALAADEWGPWAWPMPRYGAVSAWLQQEYGLTPIAIFRHGRTISRREKGVPAGAAGGSISDMPRGSLGHTQRAESRLQNVAVRFVAKRRAVAAVRALLRSGGLQLDADSEAEEAGNSGVRVRDGNDSESDGLEGGDSK